MYYRNINLYNNCQMQGGFDISDQKLAAELKRLKGDNLRKQLEIEKLIASDK